MTRRMGLQLTHDRFCAGTLSGILFCGGDKPGLHQIAQRQLMTFTQGFEAMLTQRRGGCLGEPLKNPL